tara:strand:+ start:1535 stop:2011 length:477 start_codon:yes stop_codon:yes gene_type:complete
MTALYQLRGVLGLQSRTGREVENYFDERPPIPGITLASNDARRKYRSVRHRPTEPSARYNCHGLTFAGRRTAIERPEEVERIIHDDGYLPVQRAEAAAGDIVLYYQSGTIEHSGIVVDAKEYGVIWVLSKWGELHEAVHQAHDCMYDATDLRFYRIVR